MRAALLAIALCACAHREVVDEHHDVRAVATLEALSRSSADSEQIRDTIETLHAGPVVITETWSEPAPAPDGGTVLVPHRRVTRRAPVERERKAEVHEVAHAEAATVVRAAAVTEAHADVHREAETHVAFGFQLWLVLIPLAVIAAWLILRRFIPWIP